MIISRRKVARSLYLHRCTVKRLLILALLHRRVHSVLSLQATFIAKLSILVSR